MKNAANAFFRNVPRYLFYFVMALLAVEIVLHSMHVISQYLPLVLVAAVLFIISKLLNRAPKVKTQN